ncbi:mandelate racemase/muconate lactonizing enzyme family protein [Candidatus Foliamicus sp.]
MRIESVDVRRFPVPFRLVFRHASASRSEAANVIVATRGSEGQTSYGEGCPRLYVTGETVESAAAFIEKHKRSLMRQVEDIEGLGAWIRAHGDEIDANPAAFCALEIAVLDLLGKIEQQPIEDLLGIPRLCGTFGYSAVLGDASLPVYQRQAEQYWEMGFRDFKVKVSGDADKDRRKLALLTCHGDANLRIRLDANNLWRDAADAIDYLKSLDAHVFAIEEPLQSRDFTGFRHVARECSVRIILDESLVQARQLKALDDPECWIVNLRVSKMGGIIRSLELAQEATRRGIGLIVGAQVGETSILTRASLAVMNEHRQSLVGAEGAFGTLLLEQDLTDPCLMFGRQGRLASSAGWDRTRPGLGLRIKENLLTPV